MAYGSPHYVAGQRVGGSPQAAASPHLTTSPQVPSPQGQTLDLSVNRLPHRYVHCIVGIKRSQPCQLRKLLLEIQGVGNQCPFLIASKELYLFFISR